MINKSDLLTATGSVISINDAGIAPIEQLIVPIKLKQEGEGDASPSNIRPIVSTREVSVRIINALLDNGRLNVTAPELSVFKIGEKQLMLNGLSLDPIAKILYDGETSYELSEAELDRFLKKIDVRTQRQVVTTDIDVAEGFVDAVNGVTTCTMKAFIFDEDTVPILKKNGGLSFFLWRLEQEEYPDKDSVDSQISSHLQYVPFINLARTKEPGFCINRNDGSLTFNLPEIETVEGCVRYFEEQNKAGTPVTFTWKLAENIETGCKVEKLKTFYKENTIWSSNGEVI